MARVRAMKHLKWRKLLERHMSENLGPCCACEGTDGVRNIYMLHQKSPTPGKGWGCVVCGLPSDGAVAVVCDGCHDHRVPRRFACAGWPAQAGRVPIESLTGAHDHDLSLHPELTALETAKELKCKTASSGTT